MSIEIKNLHNTSPSTAYDVRVDRTSVLGNPFFMRYEWERDSVCSRYRVWFEQMLIVKNSAGEAFKAELKRIIALYQEHGKLRLFCWCAPKHCHAEYIAEYIEAYLAYHARKEVN